jgi:hypothetical protein
MKNIATIRIRNQYSGTLATVGCLTKDWQDQLAAVLEIPVPYLRVDLSWVWPEKHKSIQRTENIHHVF